MVIDPLTVLRWVTLIALGVSLVPLARRAQHQAVRAVSVDAISVARERFARALVFAGYWLTLAVVAVVDAISPRADQTSAAVLTVLAVLMCAAQLWIDHRRSAP